MPDPQRMIDSAMMGRRILVLLPPSTKDRTKTIIGFLEAAKMRWGLQIDVVCSKIDRRGFEQLAAPSSRLYVPPHLLQAQDWERDPERVAVTERRIHEAELAAELPIGRVVMGAAHTVGRAFSAPVRTLRRYPLVRRVLKDNSEPFKIVRRLFHFADEVLAASEPDFLCAHEFATALPASLWLAAKLHNIPSVTIRLSKLHSGHGFWSTDRLMLNTMAIEEAAARRARSLPVSETAKARLKAFREQPATVHYIASRWRNRAKRGFVKWHREYAGYILREGLNSLKGQDLALVEPPVSRLIRYYWSFVTNYRQQGYLHRFDDETLKAMKYVYFPMHKEAELALTLQATQWYDQCKTTRVLASLLPYGYRLLVREHRMNCGNRDTRFYREMSRIPNVILIDPLDTQFKYLRHADLVVTENGSSGWEGLMLARRVLLLARTFYDGAGLGRTVTDPDQLNAALLDMLAKPSVADASSHDHALGCMIDAELETTFPFNSNEACAVLGRLAQTIGAALRSRAPSGETGP
jgi:Capsule polysaccharide biosynthesis protein